MLSQRVKRVLRTLVLIGLGGAFPFLYVAGVTLESSALSIVALATVGVVALMATLSH